MRWIQYFIGFSAFVLFAGNPAFAFTSRNCAGAVSLDSRERIELEGLSLRFHDFAMALESARASDGEAEKKGLIASMDALLTDPGYAYFRSSLIDHTEKTIAERLVRAEVHNKEILYTDHVEHSTYVSESSVEYKYGQPKQDLLLFEKRITLLKQALETEFRLSTELGSVLLADGRPLLHSNWEVLEPGQLDDFLKNQIAGTPSAGGFWGGWSIWWTDAAAKGRQEIKKKLIDLAASRKRSPAAFPFPESRIEVAQSTLRAWEKETGDWRTHRLLLLGVIRERNAIFREFINIASSALIGRAVDPSYFIPLVTNPNVVSQRPLLSLNFMAPSEEPAGFVLHVPVDNLIFTERVSPNVLRFAGRAEATTEVLNPRRHLWSPAELRRKSAYSNEVAAIGTHPTSGAQVGVVGVFVRTDSEGRPLVDDAERTFWREYATRHSLEYFEYPQRPGPF